MHDLVIRGGTVADGLGAEPFTGDVAVTDGRITEIGRVVTDWFDVGRVTKYGVRFVRQVWPGATLTATAVVDAIREEGGEQFADVSITTVDAEGTTVLTGTATARLDP